MFLRCIEALQCLMLSDHSFNRLCGLFVIYTFVLFNSCSSSSSAIIVNLRIRMCKLPNNRCSPGPEPVCDSLFSTHLYYIHVLLKLMVIR